MQIELSGVVTSGRQEGEKYLRLCWVQKQIEEKLGFTPYSGTLNLQLDEKSVKKKKLLEENKNLDLCQAGFCSGSIFRAFMHKLACGVVIPQVKNYPEEELEVVSFVHLRQKLGLHDGDKVSITVFI